MSKKELREMIQVIGNDKSHYSKTPEQARKFLQDVGILDQTGKIAKPYRIEKKSK